MEVSKIVLTSDEQKVFARFKRSDSAVLTKAEFQLLRRKNLVKDCIDGKSSWFDDLPEKGVCAISDFGEDLRAYQKQQTNARRKDSRRYWITTVIASAALVKSFMPEILAGLELLLKLPKL